MNKSDAIAVRGEERKDQVTRKRVQDVKRDRHTARGAFNARDLGQRADGVRNMSIDRNKLVIAEFELHLSLPGKKECGSNDTNEG